MTASVFSFLYELFLGENNEFPEYREEIFDSIGFFTFLFCGALALVFYLVMGRWRMVWYNTTHWTLTLLVCVLFGFVLAYFFTRNEIGLVDGYLVRFSLFNSLYAALFFILFSLLLKGFSIYSKRTPF